MPLMVEEDEALDPGDISSFRANAVRFEANLVTHKVKEFRHRQPGGHWLG